MHKRTDSEITKTDKAAQSTTMDADDQQSKYAIHAACREGQSESQIS